MTRREYKALVSAYLVEDSPFVAKATTEAKQRTFRNLAEYVPAKTGGITPAVILKWTAYLQEQGLNSNTIIGHRSNLLHLFKWGIERGMITENPLKPIRSLRVQPSKVVEITPEEYAKLQASQWVPNGFPWLKFAIEVGWETGLRMGDICNLRWDQIDIEARTLTIIPSKTKRLGKELILPIDNLLPLLRMLRQQAQRPASDFTGEGNHKMSGAVLVFPDAAYQYMTNQGGVSRAFSVLARKCGIPKGFHSLRHGRISQLIRKGVHVGVIRSITGQSLKVLERYIHVGIDQKREAMKL